MPEIYFETGTLTCPLAFSQNMAPCLRHNSIQRRQPESGPGTDFLGFKERLEDTRQCNGIDSHTAIRDGKYDVLPSRHRLAVYLEWPRNLPIFGLVDEQSAVLHRVPRIDRQIDNNLLQLPWSTLT